MYTKQIFLFSYFSISCTLHMKFLKSFYLRQVKMSFLFLIQIVSGLIFIAAELLKATLITIKGLLEEIQCHGFF